MLSTDPSAGKRVLKGTDVTITVSLGRAVAQLPEADRDHRGRGAGPDPQRQHGLRQGHQGVLRDACPRASSSPPTPRPAARCGSAPSSTSSSRRGARPIPVGSWAGKSADDAERALKKRGLKVDVSQQYSDSVPEGVVISQDPQDGTLFKGDTVTLLVSLGPELVEVPNVVAYGVDDATATLQDVGFVVDVQEADGYIGLGYVFSWTPAPAPSCPRARRSLIYLV